MGRPRLAVAACACLAVFACGRPAPEPAWSAGDVLLDGLADARILDAGGAPRSALPEDVSRGPGVASVEVAPGDWRPAGPVGAAFPRLDVPADATMWEALPMVRLRLGGQRPVLRHAGRVLERVPGTGFSNVWRDEPRALLLWWNRGEDLLVAIGRTAPATVVLSSQAADAPPAPGLSPALTPDPVTLHDETRRALRLPAPVRLAWPAREVHASQLRLAVALLPRLRGHDAAGRPVHVPADDAAVSLVLTAIEPDGTRRELATELLRSTGAFSDVTVALDPVAGRRVALELSLARADAGSGDFTPVLALADGAFTGATGSRPPGRGGRPHVVLIQLDTLRADRLGCYGYGRDTTPGLDAWARDEAQRFDDAVSDSNWTLPSTATLLTGLATPQHGVLAFPEALDDATPTLAERLRAAGYDTFALTEGGFVSVAFGMDRGFEIFAVQPPHASDWDPALRRLRERGDDRPVFLFLHTFRVHTPWPVDGLFADPRAPYQGPLAGRPVDDAVARRMLAGELPAGPAEVAEVNRRYDAAVRRMDDAVSAFLRALDATVPVEDRLVIVTSDHGEHLFEHGFVNHGKTLFDSVLRVPLLVSWPGAGPVGSSSAPAAGVDIAPTVLDVVGLPRPAGLAGRSLVGVGDDDRDVVRVSHHGSATHAVLLEGYKLVAGGASQHAGDAGPAEDDTAGAPPHDARIAAGITGLFHRAADPAEATDLTAAEPERAAALARALERWLRNHPPAAPGTAEAELDPELLDTLRQLGYLGDG